MAIKRVTPKTNNYGTIDRGTSLSIPVSIKDAEDLPIDLTNYQVAFTVKKTAYDFDIVDTRAYIQKDFAPQDPTNGRFFVQLSSADLDFEPGKFYFDVELVHAEGAVYRVVNLEFDLVGGPTNRTVNTNEGQLLVGDSINVISLESGKPIVTIVSILADASIVNQVNNIYGVLPTILDDIENLKDKVDNLEGGNTNPTNPDFSLSHSELENLDYAMSGHIGFASSAALQDLAQILADLELPSTGGMSDHAALENLDYASSGHTGFATAAQGVKADNAITANSIANLIQGFTYQPTTGTIFVQRVSGDNEPAFDIELATNNRPGLMSAADKKALTAGLNDLASIKEGGVWRAEFATYTDLITEYPNLDVSSTNWFVNDWIEVVHDENPTSGIHIQNNPSIYRLTVNENSTVKTLVYQRDAFTADVIADLSNSPHLWPIDGTELEFTDGSFGRRFTGTITVAANTQANTLLATISSCNFINSGGFWESDARISLGHISTSQKDNILYYLQTTSELRLATLVVSARTNAPYDVWVRYTK